MVQGMLLGPLVTLSSDTCLEAPEQKSWKPWSKRATELRSHFLWEAFPSIFYFPPDSSCHFVLQLLNSVYAPLNSQLHEGRDYVNLIHHRLPSTSTVHGIYWAFTQCLLNKWMKAKVIPSKVLDVYWNPNTLASRAAFKKAGFSGWLVGGIPWQFSQGFHSMKFQHKQPTRIFK